jgi:K+-sensing histidine kinase KdpD
MDRRRISSNGAWRRAQLPSVSPVSPLAARWQRSRNALSAFGVALACLMAAAGESAISHPPLLLLAAAMAVASSLFGLGPDLFALAVATPASDFFFIHPKNAFSFNQRSLGSGFYYALAGLISYLYVRRRRKGGGGPSVNPRYDGHTSRPPRSAHT